IAHGQLKGVRCRRILIVDEIPRDVGVGLDDKLKGVDLGATVLQCSKPVADSRRAEELFDVGSEDGLVELAAGEGQGVAGLAELAGGGGIEMELNEIGELRASVADGFPEIV